MRPYLILAIIGLTLTLSKQAISLDLLPLRKAQEKTLHRPYPKLNATFDSVLEKMRADGVTRQNARSKNLKRFSSSFVRVDNDGMVRVRLRLNAPLKKSERNELTRLGVKTGVELLKLNLLQAWIPFDALQTVSLLPFIQKIDVPGYGRTRSGSKQTEGDAILQADQLREFGFDGTGVTVGVISDGVEGLASAQSSDDLPSDVTVFGTCDTLYSYCDEGTAMLEIVHDVAPGATLAAGAIDDDIDFIQRITDLQDFGANVIVDDIGFFLEPYFEDGNVADAVAGAVSNGVLYASAAGNDAENYYEGDFTDDGTQIHDFGVASGGATDTTMDVLVAGGGGTLTVFLQWADPFGASSNNYDLAIYQSDGTTLVDSSTFVQDGDDDPIEYVGVANGGGSTARAKIVVQKVSGADRPLKMVIVGDIFIEEYNVAAGSIFGHPAVPGALAVAAIDAGDVGNNEIESFSSQGPVTIAFPSPESRAKPDISGIDGVKVTGANGFPSPFYGTSAAAPHIAALGALLLSGPASTRDEAVEALTSTAIDLGAADFDTVYGYGRADVLEAAKLANDDPDSEIDIPETAITVQRYESVDFAGNCSDNESIEGATYTWSFGADSGIEDSTDQNPGEKKFTKEGSYEVTLTCTDSFGATDSTPSTVTVSVEGSATLVSKVGGCAAQSGFYLLLPLIVLALLPRRRTFFLSLILTCASVQAQTIATVRGPTATVYEKPDGKTKILTRLKSGDGVTILRELGGWVQIKTSPPLSISGWADKRLIEQQPFTPQGAQATSAIVTPLFQAEEKNEPEDFDENWHKRTPVFPSSEMELSAGLRYLSHTYSISSGGSSASPAFSYSLPGFGFSIDGAYRMWTNRSRSFQLSSEFSYAYGVYNQGTFQANTDTEQVTAESDNRTHEFSIRIPAFYRWDVHRSHFKTGGYIGFDYYKFSANDALDSAGNPINMFITQTTKCMSVGFLASYAPSALPALSVTAGIGLLPVNSVKENPENTTGTNPSAGLGLIPSLRLDWTFLARHQVGAGYLLRLQDYSYQGTSSRIAADTIADGEASTKTHNVFLEYRFFYD